MFRVENEMRPDKTSYQSEIDRLLLNAESVLQKAVAIIDLSESPNAVVGGMFSSAIISVPVNTNTTVATARSNNIGYSNITDCLGMICAKYKTSLDNLRVVYLTTEPNVDLQNLNDNISTPSLKISIFQQDTNKQLDTSICKESEIFVKNPLRGAGGVNMNRYIALKNDSIDTFDPEQVAFNDRCYPYLDKEKNRDTTMNLRRREFFQGYTVACNVRQGDCTYLTVENGYVTCNCTKTDPTNEIYASLIPRTLSDYSNINFDVFGCAGTAFVNIF
jgi:hypothetical protein